jgi:hypothetical protein
LLDSIERAKVGTDASTVTHTYLCYFCFFFIAVDLIKYL